MDEKSRLEDIIRDEINRALVPYLADNINKKKKSILSTIVSWVWTDDKTGKFSGTVARTWASFFSIFIYILYVKNQGQFTEIDIEVVQILIGLFALNAFGYSYSKHYIPYAATTKNKDQHV